MILLYGHCWYGFVYIVVGVFAFLSISLDLGLVLHLLYIILFVYKQFVHGHMCIRYILRCQIVWQFRRIFFNDRYTIPDVPKGNFKRHKKSFIYEFIFQTPVNFRIHNSYLSKRL